MRDLNSAIVIVLDDARPQLEPVREEFHAQEVAAGIPLHVTLLYPFAPPDRVDEEALADFFAGYDAFTLTLRGLATWPQVVYAVPEPRDQLLAMMHALIAKYPEYPPYEGEIAEPEPHAVALALPPSPGLHDRLHAGIFPLRVRAHEVSEPAGHLVVVTPGEHRTPPSVVDQHSLKPQDRHFLQPSS